MMDEWYSANSTPPSCFFGRTLLMQYRSTTVNNLELLEDGHEGVIDRQLVTDHD